MNTLYIKDNESIRIIGLNSLSRPNKLNEQMI